jgi:hypothetical protein
MYALQFASQMTGITEHPNSAVEWALPSGRLSTVVYTWTRRVNARIRAFVPCTGVAGSYVIQELSSIVRIACNSLSRAVTVIKR